LAAVNEADCKEGDNLLPSGMLWGTIKGAIAIYQFNVPVAAQAYGMISPGYEAAVTTDHFSWSVAFPSSTTASVCATAFNRANAWSDTSLKGLIFVPS
jgi:hypothetical protein